MFRPCHLSLSLALLCAPAWTQSTFMVGSAQNGAYGNSASKGGHPSFDGRWMSFTSSDSNIHPTGSSQDHIYVKDLATWGVELVSVSSAGVLGDGPSFSSKLSHDGRYVVFASNATNLEPKGNNGRTDIYLRDRWAGTTTIQDLGTTLAVASTGASEPAISGDGRLVLFLSTATNLVPGVTGGFNQAYVRDHALATIAAVSLSTAGLPANADVGAADLSGDGRYVVFDSDATNLVAGDTNGARDVFLRDQTLGTTVRISVDGSGLQANGNSHDPVISADGRFVAYVTGATNVVVPDTNGREDVVVYDVLAGAVERITTAWNGAEADGDSDRPSISFDGRYVAFETYAGNLITGDTNGGRDVYVRDRSVGSIEIASVTTGSAFGAGLGSFDAAISPNGRFVCLSSLDALVVPAPPPSVYAYARERGLVCISPYAYCTAKVNSLGCTPFIATYGCSSASVDEGFFVLGANVRNNKTGLLFYSLFGQASNPFQGGTMCVAAPRKRTPIRNSGGNPVGDDCSGLFVIDMNQFAAGLGGGNPRPELSVPGTVVDCQWWSRDPGSSFNVNLTNALEYLVGL